MSIANSYPTVKQHVSIVISTSLLFYKLINYEVPKFQTLRRTPTFDYLISNKTSITIQLPLLHFRESNFKLGWLVDWLMSNEFHTFVFWQRFEIYLEGKTRYTTLNMYHEKALSCHSTQPECVQRYHLKLRILDQFLPLVKNPFNPISSSIICLLPLSNKKIHMPQYRI